MATTTAFPQSDQAQRHSQKPLRWLSVVSHLDPRFGGLSAAVPRLSAAIATNTGFEMNLAAFCSQDESLSSPAYLNFNRSEWPISRSAWLKQRTLSRSFLELAETMDGLHIHGLWEQSSQTAARAARSLKLPYVLSAHGMLEPWALNNKRFKKLLYSALIERTNVRNASCLHALTSAEAEDYRRYGARSPIAIIPNGVDIPPDIDSSFFFSQYPNLRGKRIVLFLGRIHFKKGLDILVRAWKVISANHANAQLVLAGPDFEGTQAAIETAVRQSNLNSSITFTGMLQDQAKWSALRAAECFVLPSYSEGLSVSALEAMAAGLPVILTDRCNLPEVSKQNAGWVIPASAAPLQRALEELLESRPSENRVIGQRGCKLIQDRYTWAHVASQMSEVYTWVAGGNLPDSVALETFGGRS